MTGQPILGITQEYMDAFVEGYKECALWSTIDETYEEATTFFDSGYGIDDIAEVSAKDMAQDCFDFVTHNANDLEGIDAPQAGHDFWLTRNHHGAGFWDRGLGERGDRLTKAAHVYGSVDLYSLDGKVYQQ